LSSSGLGIASLRMVAVWQVVWAKHVDFKGT
jgi:hypothetical protein